MTNKITPSAINESIEDLINMLSLYEEQEKERISKFLDMVLNKKGTNTLEQIDVALNVSDEVNPINSLNILTKVTEKREAELVVIAEAKNKLLTIKDELKVVGSRFGQAN